MIVSGWYVAAYRLPDGTIFRVAFNPVTGMLRIRSTEWEFLDVFPAHLLENEITQIVPHFREDSIEDNATPVRGGIVDFLHGLVPRRRNEED